MKKFFWLLVVSLVLVGGYFFLTGFAEYMIVRGVEKYGSRAVGCAVRLEGADLSIWKGRGELTGLSVDNPRGFKEARAIFVDRAGIDLDLSSIFSNRVLIREVEVSGAQLYVEQNSRTNNLQVLAQNRKKRSVSSPDSADSGEKKMSGSEEEGESGLLLEIRELRISDVRVEVDAPGRSAAVTLPEIRLRDIGTAENGIPPKEVSQEVIRAVMGQLTTVLVNGFMDLDPDCVKGLGEDLRRRLEGGDGDKDVDLQKKADRLKELFN
ncbi:MAG: hypothetical protein ACLFSY_05640 [Desulfonatronovibrionaceae bacterium]